MAIAYQAGIPIIVVDRFGGWAEKIADNYIDDRKRLKCLAVDTPSEAISLAISSVNK